jgi:DNA polymerase III alpha subunit
MKSFTHLHVHSRASFLDASCSAEALAKQAKTLGMPAIALTDHNNLFNAVPFYKACQKSGVKPILGVEINFVEDCAESIQLKNKTTHHVVLLAENNIGWQNIVKMVNLANDEKHYYYTPRIDYGMLEAHKEGVILLTSCHDGILASHLKPGEDGQVTNTFKAEAIIRKLLTIYDRDHVYVEVQDMGDPIYQLINTALRKVAMKYGVKTVATNDVHYTYSKDAEAHKALRRMAEFQRSNASGSTFNTDEYFIKSREEMDKLSFSEAEKDLATEIADRCNVNINFTEKRLPSYGFLPEGKTAMQHLRDEVINNTSDWSADYKARLDKELKDIEALGFADYFLIVADVVGWARQQNIMVGPGRGSAGGSLVSYALGVTNIDPMKYGLIWERFLNVGRKSLPDIDTDFPRSKRAQVIDYIRARFGHERVTQLATFNKLAARAVLKEVFKIYGMSFDEANAITSLVPLKNDEHSQVSLDEAIIMVPELQAYEEKYKAWFAVARALEGCYKSLGTHAAAVVISNKDFSEGEYPLCRASDNKSLIFAWDMQSVDDLGLLKLDVLGLSTLDIIQDTLDIVNKRHKLSLTLDTIPLDDQKTFTLMGEGKTVGVFQLEKQLGKTWSKQLKPQSIEEISDLVSLIRPGPMECLDGETKILVRTDYHKQYKTIKQLYDEGIRRTLGDKRYSDRIICVDNNHKFEEGKIKRVVKSGKKKLWRVKVDQRLCGYNSNGEQASYLDILASDNHKFLTNDGWKALKDILPGQYVAIMNYRTGRSSRDTDHVIGRKNFRNIAFNHYIYSCLFCDWQEGSLDVNHINGDRNTDNHPDNLCFLCPNHHRLVTENNIDSDQLKEMQRHYKLSYTDDVMFVRYTGKEFVKEDETYDIEVVGPHHNFIAGGFVVHNSKMHEMYRDVKAGERMPDYVHHSLKPILDPTYGALLYQEQVIEICKVLAGMSLIDADLVRKAMGKKKPEEMRKWQKTFVDGCVNNRIPEDAAEQIWSYIDKFSGYGFNKSHGIGYALLAYYTAFLKANYTIEFICANLKNSEGAQDTMEDINQFVYDAKLFGIEVLPPKIEVGNSGFDIINDKQIAFGLSSLKGAGEKGIETARKALAATDKKEDYHSFLFKTYEVGVNRRVMEALIYGGGFDSFKMSRNQMFAHFDLYELLTDNERKIIADHAKYNWVEIVRALSDDMRSATMKEQWQIKIPNIRRRATLQELLKTFDASDAFDNFISKIAWEKEFLGISLSGDETNLFSSKHKCSDIIKFAGEDMPVDVIVRVEGIKKHITKNKEEMAFLTVADNTGKLDNFVVFPRTWDYAKNLIIVGNIARIYGKVDKRGSVLVNKMERVR